MHQSGICSLLFALRGFEGIRWQIGKLGTWLRFRAAAQAVPAYAEFLNLEGMRHPALLARISTIPPMDKENYVKRFPLERRCIGGAFPAGGMMVDESSGSSGSATNWVRGVAERNANRRTLKFGVRNRLGNQPLFFLNAFALGPWATGVNLTLSLAQWTRIKTIGPDIRKIEATLLEFGTSHHYVIIGYPPFLKQLVDRAAVDWRKYRVSMLFGGEGMSESMRRYLENRGIARVYGSYGASDLELNIAAESDFTIALRRLLEARPEIAEPVLRHAGAMPMIFQFNPADFFFESTAEGELLATICRPDYLAPKIRYNIHDVGHVLRMPELLRILSGFGVTMNDLDARALDLPLLFHYGRSDASVAYYGCKIPPADVQEALFRHAELASVVDSFQMRTYDDDEGDKRLVLALEMPARAIRGTTEELRAVLFDTLAEINQDFRESRRMVPPGKEPSLEICEPGSGPFEGADIRIKRRYVKA